MEVERDKEGMGEAGRGGVKNVELNKNLFKKILNVWLGVAALFPQEE